MDLMNGNAVGSEALGCSCACGCSCSCTIECILPWTFSTNSASLNTTMFSNQSTSGFEHGRDA